MTHAMFLDMWGFRYVIDGKLEDTRESGARFIWSSYILYLAQRGVVSLSDLKDTINDRRKADGLSKAVVCIQVLWFLVKCAARVQKRLAITELEVSTVAYIAVCATCYIFWWTKPVDVKTHIDIHITSAQAREMEKWNPDEKALLSSS
ncbi:hypothetical protein BYT27DRAFT_7212934 [Phlegmacium glaucopus]|nr:hypothetical protein BYT27DRAFT_7212934 [Phlegmacium glaucopus]